MRETNQKDPLLQVKTPQGALKYEFYSFYVGFFYEGVLNLAKHDKKQGWCSISKMHLSTTDVWMFSPVLL